jgi:hypothetical protein
MGKLDQIRRGMERVIGIDKDIGILTRRVKADSGRGQLIPTDETVTRKLICRVSYQSGGVWPGRQWEGGLTIDTSPFVLAVYNADLEQGDELEWRGKKYTVGVVSRPDLACTQAPLVDVK